MRYLALLLLLATPALADTEIFHGWSRDGTWLVYEVHGNNDIVELYFCATDQTVTPTWPAVLNDQEHTDERSLPCVRFIDPNKAPYEWKKQLVLPETSMQSGAVKMLSELVLDGEQPGFALQAGDKKQVCYASGVRDDSKLQKVYFHPNGRWVGVMLDGTFRHCALTLKGAGTKTAPPPPKKK